MVSAIAMQWSAHAFKSTAWSLLLADMHSKHTLMATTPVWAADPFLNDQNFILSVVSLEELGATGNKVSGQCNWPVCLLCVRFFQHCVSSTAYQMVSSIGGDNRLRTDPSMDQAWISTQHNQATVVLLSMSLIRIVLLRGRSFCCCSYVQHESHLPVRKWSRLHCPSPWSPHKNAMLAHAEAFHCHRHLPAPCVTDLYPCAYVRCIMLLVLLQGLAGIVGNPVLSQAIAGLATSATAQATLERVMLFDLKDKIIEPFGETAQQVFARISAMRDSLDGPQVCVCHQLIDSLASAMLAMWTMEILAACCHLFEGWPCLHCPFSIVVCSGVCLVQLLRTLKAGCNLWPPPTAMQQCRFVKACIPSVVWLQYEVLHIIEHGSLQSIYRLCVGRMYSLVAPLMQQL